ncbi:hypothetical protein EV182_000078 [Spiromyces aspiralis]|uniref:Uncharacterized protein n=1 Tax=Spiromyces aspiralis TaxID=68401 RepID=A0ACC1HNW7_9FUNG|nr:hypothetical protein EV182_000078 [Spiromyces aspiralis]
MFLCELPEVTFVVNCGWGPSGAEIEGTAKERDRGAPKQDAFSALKGIDWGSVDFILIPNYEQMGLLPWITEYTDFRGDMYMTEPTQEPLLADMLARGTGSGNDDQNVPSTSKTPLFPSSSSTVYANTSPDLPQYTLQDVSQCIEKATDVRYNEVIKPLISISLHAKSAGYCIGSANWVVEYKGQRIVFVSSSSFLSQLHPRELDTAILRDIDIVVFSDLNLWQDLSGTIPALQALLQLAGDIVYTVKQKGHSIVMTRPYGLVNDLLQVVTAHIKNLALVSPQYIFVSPVAERTMQLGNIMGEWLNSSKREALYIPEYPFVERELRQENCLYYISSIADLATLPLPTEPCVVFVGTQDRETLRYLLKLWGRSNANAIFFYDIAEGQSLLNSIDVPHRLQVHSHPIDLRLDRHDVARLVELVGGNSHIVVPATICSALQDDPRLLSTTTLHGYSHLDVLTLELGRDTHYNIMIRGQLTKEAPTQAVESLKYPLKRPIPVRGRIEYVGNRLLLDTTAVNSGNGDSSDRGGTERVNVDALLAVLSKENVQLRTQNLTAADPKVQTIRADTPYGQATLHINRTDNDIGITCQSMAVQNYIRKLMSQCYM